MRVQFLSWEDPLEEGLATHSSILPGESHGQRSLVGYRPWGRREWDTTERLSTHAPMAIPCPQWERKGRLCPTHL